MITVLINATVKLDRLEEYKSIASLLSKESRKRPGCISYIFNQRIDKPTEFVLYEQWESKADLDAHLLELAALLGPPASGEVLPEKLLDMYETAEAAFYEAIE